jgi:hypothetical protein
LFELSIFIDWIPGMPPISLGDISSFLRVTDPDDLGLRFTVAEANNCTKADAIVLNIFDVLEADVLAAMRAEYPPAHLHIDALASRWILVLWLHLRNSVHSRAVVESVGLYKASSALQPRHRQAMLTKNSLSQ